jgi:hypothetical protein
MRAEKTVDTVLFVPRGGWLYVRARSLEIVPTRLYFFQD